MKITVHDTLYSRPETAEVSSKKVTPLETFYDHIISGGRLI